MTADNPSKPNHLDPSELGTKEYWDSLYTTELTNHTSNPSDRGTVWFDDSDAEAKLLEYLEDQTTTTTTSSSSSSSSQQQHPLLDRNTTSFLDLGCGNGSLLLALRDDGWAGRALGVDYSDKSVALARQVAQAHRRDEEEEEKVREELDDDEEGECRGDGSSSSSSRVRNEEVEFAAWDVLQGSYDAVLSGAQAQGWDVVLDKGTFDAISLSEEQGADGRRSCEGYKGRVVRLVRPGGLFLVTSCNWTEEELERWFGEGSSEVEGGRFVRVGKVEYPSFSFGGVKGQTISTLCFQRV
ncbi:S-adenosyl-L-methionine-dependent methyltransferase [Cryphonectria parasitica EP155]|uniref:Protein-lysine N-methyltransferase EFM4 n=1 Tax=Cryphonectria parasitica (strain ATCC 38755 / EP155) TaxID=660469 RepID=A0A9P4YBP1_CRYP1|nr:S-adenosyl-L-methionine-dependent methyltransferase [Cryphonectria parasitica EP155]KAF3770093.1 S-adenosyl-L-methionine-dependent methyltransferase [Cryphonectria parasitica EP155]